MLNSLDCQRHRFQLPDTYHYLNCAYMSPLPDVVEHAGVHGLLQKRLPTDLPAASYFSGVDEVRALFAQLVNATDPQRVALLPSVSYAVSTVARHLPVQPGQNLVVIGDEFPSAVLPWRRLASERNVELRTVEAPNTTTRRAEGWNEALYEAIDLNTAAVMLAPVHWSDGTKFDLPTLATRARQVGAAVVVDGTQSVGALPFDVAEVQPDLLVCAAYKWLFAGYGLSVAYFGPRFDHAMPLEETWTSQAGSHDFARLAQYQDAYQDKAVRFDGGQRANFVLVPMLAAAIRLLLEWRVENVQRYCRSLTTPLVEGALERGAVVEESTWRAAHLVGVRLPGADMAAVSRRLEERGVYVSLRGDALRVSPNVYNTSEDVAAFVHALPAKCRSTVRMRSKPAKSATPHPSPPASIA